MNEEKIFSKIGYPYLDEMIEKVTAEYPGVKILFPIADFTTNNTLFKVGTFNVDIAINAYSKYKEEVEFLNKEINRLDKTIDNINNKFCNEQWLTKCPEDIIKKEYDKLSFLEEERELKHKQIIDRLHIRPTFIPE